MSDADEAHEDTGMGLSEEELAAELAEREERARESIEAVEAASRAASSALREWAGFLRDLIASRPSIGDSLLDARDRKG